MSYIKKLNKELIVISGLTGMRLADFTKKTTGFCTAATDNPTIAPNLEPTPLALNAKNELLLTKVAERVELEKDLKALTLSINADKDEIMYLVNNGWCQQIQTAVKGDIEKVIKLGFLAKGVVTGKAIVVAGMAFESHPIINYIDNSNHLEHRGSIINNMTGKVAVPKDASRIEVYMQIGGIVPPVDILKMAHLGPAKRGKFSVIFDSADLDKTVYYIVVYIDKHTQTPMTQSAVFSAVIT